MDAAAQQRLEEALEILGQADGAGAGAADACARDEWLAGQVLEALSFAKQALVAFRRAGDAESKVQALEAVVRANLALGDTFDALLVAQDELAMIRRTGDRPSTLKALLLVARVQGSRGEGSTALETVAEALTLARGLADRSGEAKALQQRAWLQLALGEEDEAMASAEEALQVFRQLGSQEGEEAASRMLSMVYVAKGQIDNAPGRAAALAALEDLSAAIERRDAQAWNIAMQALEKTGAYTQTDVEGCVQSAVKGGGGAAAAFLEEVGAHRTGDYGAGGMTISEVSKVSTYIGFRMGGMGYGPRFRCLQAHKLECPGKPSFAPSAVSALGVSDQADDWETLLNFHPGCLDGMLLGSSALN